MATRNTFLQILYKYWHASREELLAAIANGEFEGVTMSSLLKAYLDFQLQESEYHDYRVSPSSLKYMVFGKIIEELKITEDLAAVTRDIARSLEHVVYLQLLSDPRLPYRILRTFLKIPLSDIPNSDLPPNRELVDVDEVILANAEYLRRTYTSVNNQDHLVTLEDLSNILAPSKEESGYQSFRNMYPPTGGFDSFNVSREGEVRLLTHETDFVEAFNDLTSRFLYGLDWTNVFVAGELVLASLTGEEIRGKSIWLYLYGLNANDANKKVDHIYDVWVANLPYDQAKLVTKTAKQISFFGSEPTHPIQIEVKLYRNITDILLSRQYDQYAIGYNGSRILMLPSCARIIEKGFKNIATPRAPRQPSREERFTEVQIEDELPTSYDWENPELHFTELASDIDDHNRILFTQGLQTAICQQLQIRLQRFGYNNYLTRRIRRQVYGSDLKEALQKQITIPLMMPFDLESHIKECLNLGVVSGPRSWYSQNPVIDVHDPAKHDNTTAQLPSLVPTSDEQGNPKYWILSNESMWAGQDKTQDAVSEILWCLFAWFWYVLNGGYDIYGTDSAECVVWTIQYLRKELGVLPGLASSKDGVNTR